MIHTIKIFLTYRCNFNCDYCFVTHSDEVMSPEILEKILIWGISNGIKKIILTGGEPTSNFELIKQAGIFIRTHAPEVVFDDIPTNGTQLDTQKIRIAKKLGLSFAFSLDGFNFEDNKFRYRDKIIYNKILRNLRLYVKEFRKKPRIKLTVNNRNAHRIHKNVSSLLEKGLTNVQIFPAFSREWTDEGTEHFLKSYDALINIHRAYELSGKKIKVDPIDWYIDVIKRGNYAEITDNHSDLGRKVAFSPSGDAYASLSMMHIKNNAPLKKEYFLGNINDDIDLSKLKYFRDYRICQDIEMDCIYTFPNISCKKPWATLDLKTGEKFDKKHVQNLVQIEYAMFKKVYDFTTRTSLE